MRVALHVTATTSTRFTTRTCMYVLYIVSYIYSIVIHRFYSNSSYCSTLASSVLLAPAPKTIQESSVADLLSLVFDLHRFALIILVLLVRYRQFVCLQLQLKCTRIFIELRKLR